MASYNSNINGPNYRQVLSSYSAFDVGFDLTAPTLLNIDSFVEDLIEQKLDYLVDIFLFFAKAKGPNAYNTLLKMNSLILKRAIFLHSGLTYLDPQSILFQEHLRKQSRHDFISLIYNHSQYIKQHPVKLLSLPGKEFLLRHLDQLAIYTDSLFLEPFDGVNCYYSRMELETAAFGPSYQLNRSNGTYGGFGRYTKKALECPISLADSHSILAALS